jgi:hypothetical protein
MKYLKTLQLALIAVILFSCSSDSKLERRITALERRVASLESGDTVEKRPINDNVSLASNPKKINDNSPKPVFTIESTEFDFGRVNEGDIVNHIFEFTNTGKSPLVIDKATASCGCTVPDWPKDPIGVGETGEIKVRFDTKGKPMQQIKTISIMANTEPALTRLRIKGFVTPKNQPTAGPVK